MPFPEFKLWLRKETVAMKQACQFFRRRWGTEEVQTAGYTCRFSYWVYQSWHSKYISLGYKVGLDSVHSHFGDDEFRTNLQGEEICIGTTTFFHANRGVQFQCHCLLHSNKGPDTCTMYMHSIILNVIRLKRPRNFGRPISWATNLYTLIFEPNPIIPKASASGQSVDYIMITFMIEALQKTEI